MTAIDETKLRNGWKSEDVPQFPALLSLDDPDDVEEKLLEWAHYVSMNAEKSQTKAVGRVIKLFIPAFTEMLRSEAARKDDTPIQPRVLNGLINACGLMLSLALSGSIKAHKVEEAIETTFDALKAMVEARVTDAVRNRNYSGGKEDSWGAKEPEKPKATSVPSVPIVGFGPKMEC